MNNSELGDNDSESIVSDVLLRLGNTNENTSNFVYSDNEYEENCDSLLDKMRSNSFINNAVNLYEQTKSQHPNFKRRAERIERTMVKGWEETSNVWKKQRRSDRNEEQVDICENIKDKSSESNYNSFEDKKDGMIVSTKLSKRQKIKENLKEYQLNMSIESKKKLLTCLHLLNLANKQLSIRISSLQDLVLEEQQNMLKGQDIHTNDSDEEEEFHDAKDFVNKEKSTEIKLEVVGTIKKIYVLISKFTGNSLPEPARTQVRESLLKLPINWTIRMNSSNSSKSKINYTNNGKVLELAKESLTMISNIIKVVDNSLGKAEEWIKNKHELKEMIKEQYKQAQIRGKIKSQLFKDISI